MRTALLLMLLAAGGCKPRTSLPQTDPKTWSKGGWQDFRWGMGPGDVELLLREAKGDLAPLRRDSLPPLEKSQHNADISHTAYEGMGTINIAGMPCGPMFSFYLGELYAVLLTPHFPDYYRPKEQWAWYASVAGLLTEKYGQPSFPAIGQKVDGARSWEPFVWSTESSKIEVSAIDGFVESVKGSGKFDRPDVSIAVHFFDPGRAKLADGVNPADKSKL